MRTKTIVPLLLALVFLAGLPLAAQTVPTLQEIKTSLICQCGCAMTVEACQGAMACEAASQLTAQAQKLIDQGLNKKAILASFVSRYGEQILSAPTKRGFNLTAWITPFFAIVVSGFAITKVVRQWSKRRMQNHRKPKTGASNGADLKYSRLVEDVLRQLDA